MLNTMDLDIILAYGSSKAEKKVQAAGNISKLAHFETIIEDAFVSFHEEMQCHIPF